VLPSCALVANANLSQVQRLRTSPVRLNINHLSHGQADLLATSLHPILRRICELWWPLLTVVAGCGRYAGRRSRNVPLVWHRKSTVYTMSAQGRSASFVVFEMEKQPHRLAWPATQWLTRSKLIRVPVSRRISTSASGSWSLPTSGARVLVGMGVGSYTR
jgi:hypothetical protein